MVVRNCEPLLLNSTQVARLLGISPRTVCMWAECSELPGFKVGRQWRFRSDAICGWLEKSDPGTRLGKNGPPFTAAATAASAASTAYNSD